MAWAPPRSRPFGWYVARTMIPRTLVFLSLAAALLVGHALEEPIGTAACTPGPVDTSSAVAHDGSATGDRWRVGACP